jgi:PIN domain nuclease of toxin-antitoxin system
MSPYRMSFGWARNETSARHSHLHLVGRSTGKTLTRRASALEHEANELLLSVASVWEMQIKIQLGKLKLSLPLKELLKNQQETNDLTVSQLTLTHVLALDSLSFHHKDPFDRLLIAQSIEDKLTIVTADSQFSAYSVKLLQ